MQVEIPLRFYVLEFMIWMHYWRQEYPPEELGMKLPQVASLMRLRPSSTRHLLEKEHILLNMNLLDVVGLRMLQFLQ